MRGREFIVVLLLALVVTTCGCLFNPRDPEPPGQEDEDPWVNPIAPKNVFLNLQTGLKNKSNSNYERSLDPSYTFVPRPEDEAALGSDVFANWTKNVELDVITRLKGEYLGERTVQFGDENLTFERESIEVGKAEFEGDYEIVLNRKDGSKETYAGKAIFYIEETTQGWVLKKWEDIDVSGTNPTSGYLRGTLRGSG